MKANRTGFGGVVTRARLAEHIIRTQGMSDAPNRVERRAAEKLAKRAAQKGAK